MPINHLTRTMAHIASTLLACAALFLAVSAEEIEISTAAEFYDCAVKIASGDETYAAASYRLTNSIGFYGESFYPFGTASYPFTGTFDGNGYSLCDITYKSSAASFGVFGAAKDAVIKNLNVVGADFTVSGGTLETGFLVGHYENTRADTTAAVSNCSVSGKLTVNSRKAATVYAGGLFGTFMAAASKSSVSVCDCFVNADLTVKGCTSAYVGGVAGKAGYNDGSGAVHVQRIVVRGSLNVSASAGADVGGIAGFLRNEAPGWIVGGAGPDASLSAVRANDDIRDCIVLASVSAVSSITRVSPSAANSTEQPETHDLYYGSNFTDTYDAGELKADETCFSDASFLADKVHFDLDTVWTLPKDAAFPFLRRRTSVFVEKSAKYIETDGVRIRTVLCGAPEAALFAAAYDADGRMTGQLIVHAKEDFAGTLYIPSETEPAAVRLFALDGCKPLCAAFDAKMWVPAEEDE